MPACDFKAFKLTTNKVKLLTFHPIQPWLAYADRGTVLSVLDWTTQQIFFETSIGSAEEAAAVDVALQRLAERDPSYYGAAPASQGIPPKQSYPGILRDTCFLDLDTCFWQIAQHQILQCRALGGASVPDIGNNKVLKAHKWLVAACESRVILQDLVDGRTIDVPRTLLETKAPSAIAVLYVNSSKLLAEPESEERHATQNNTAVSPVLAVGTTSGTIYLISISLDECTLSARLVGGHKGGVTKLVAIGGEESSSPERLVSAGTDGSVALWDPSAAVAASSTSRDVAPKCVAKPHDADILSMTVAAGAPTSTGGGRLRLVTSGEDRRVSILDLPTLTGQVARWKPLAKGSIDGLCCASWGQPGSQLMGVSGAVAAVLSMPLDGRQPDANVLLGLDNFLPVGTKKAAKIYAIAAHPLQPGIIAVGANSGLGIISVERNLTVPAASLPARASASRRDPLGKGSGLDRAFEYLYMAETSLWHIAYRTSWDLDAAGRQLNASVASSVSVAKVALAVGTAEVSTSPDGSHCSIVWPEANQFLIFTNVAGDNWQEVQNGSGVAVAWASWASTGQQFAVLHLPQVRYPEVRRGKSKKGKAREEEAAAQAAAVAASLAAQESGHVKVYSISENGAVAATTSIRLSDKPLRLHGGALLGVTTSKTFARGQRRGPSMQFFSWASGAAVGPEMLAPEWVSWEPRVTALALGYAHAVVLCRTQPSVTPIASLPVQNTTSSAWHHNMLLFASPLELHGVFVSAGPEKTKAPFMESLKIASLEGGVVSQMASAGDATASRPSEGLRCAGPCAIGGIREGALWLIDARGVPFIVPLVHAGLRARVAAAQGDASAACAVAEAGLSKSKHDEIAFFLAEMLPGKGLEEALALSGISLSAELALSRRATKFRRALRCLQALALGAGASSAFREFPSWNTHISESTPLEAATAPREAAPLPFQHLIQHMRTRSMDVMPAPTKPDPRQSVLAFIAADNADEESSEDEELEEQAEAMMGLAQAPAELIDWDAMLSTQPAPAQPDPEKESQQTGSEQREDAHTNGVAAATDTAGEASDAGQKQENTITHEDESRIAGLIDEGLLLVDAALGYGHQDVATAALRLLLRGAPHLRSQQLQALLMRCAQCEMRAELRAFASRIVMDGAGASPETSSLVAALLDDVGLAHSTLRASGLIPLAAIYSHTYKHGNSLQDISDWGSFLTAAAGSGVQYAVTPPVS